METKIKEIERHLPKDWKEQCRESKALVRGREIKTAEELLELNLLYLTVGGSFGATSALLNLTTEKTMSKKAVYTMIQNSAEWLRIMSEKMLEESGMKIPKPEWLDKDIILIDGSEMSIKGMEYVIESGADFILRYRKNAFNLYDKNGKKIDITARIGHLKELEGMSFTGFDKAKNKLKPVRLVAMKKTEEAQKETERKMKLNCSRKGRNIPEQETLELNKYIILATNLDYSDEKIPELYRCRWRIELVFKRPESLFDFSGIPGKNPETAKAWFYGKLFLAVLCETILKAESFSPEKEKENSEEQT